MNSRDRMFAVLEGKIPDRVPIAEIWIDQKVFQNIYPGKSYYDFIEESDYYDAVSSLAGIVPPGIDWIDREKKTFRDKWGAHQQFTGEAIPIIIPPVRIDSEADLISYSPPDPKNPAIVSTVQEMVRKFKDKKALVFVGEDVWQKYPKSIISNSTAGLSKKVLKSSCWETITPARPVPLSPQPISTGLSCPDLPGRLRKFIKPVHTASSTPMVTFGSLWTCWWGQVLTAWGLCWKAPVWILP